MLLLTFLIMQGTVKPPLSLIFLCYHAYVHVYLPCCIIIMFLCICHHDKGKNHVCLTHSRDSLYFIFSPPETFMLRLLLCHEYQTENQRSNSVLAFHLYGHVIIWSQFPFLCTKEAVLNQWFIKINIVLRQKSISLFHLRNPEI